MPAYLLVNLNLANLYYIIIIWINIDPRTNMESIRKSMYIEDLSMNDFLWVPQGFFFSILLFYPEMLYAKGEKADYSKFDITS